MFGRLGNAVKELNVNVADVATCEKAKKLRKKLLTFGIVGVVLGALMILGGIIMFMIPLMSPLETVNGLPVTSIIGMIMFMIGGGLSSISVVLIYYGLAILVGGATAKFVDKSINQRCECGEVILSSSKYCPKCGLPVRKTCECGHVNDSESKYCTECGKKLN